MKIFQTIFFLFLSVGLMAQTGRKINIGSPSTGATAGQPDGFVVEAPTGDSLFIFDGNGNPVDTFLGGGIGDWLTLQNIPADIDIDNTDDVTFSDSLTVFVTPQQLSDSLSAQVDNVDDADNDPNNENQTWATLPGIPTNIDTDSTNDVTLPDSLTVFVTPQQLSDSLSVQVDNVDDADNDPNNENQTWATLPGIPADIDTDSTNDVTLPDSLTVFVTPQQLSDSLSAQVDDVGDGYSVIVPTKDSIITFTKDGIPIDTFFINTTVVDNDPDPTNELQNWATLPAIPANIDTDSTNDVTLPDSLTVFVTPQQLSDSLSAQVDNVDDADNDPNNENQTWATLPGIPADIDTDSTNDVTLPDSLTVFVTPQQLSDSLSAQVDDVGDGYSVIVPTKDSIITFTKDGVPIDTFFTTAGGGDGYILEAPTGDSLFLFNALDVAIDTFFVPEEIKYFLGAGQSNMLGNTNGDNESDLSTNPLVEAFNGTDWVLAQIGVAPFDQNNGSDNLLFHFGKREAERCGCKVRLILSAFGGNAIEQWIPETDVNFQDIITQLTAGEVDHLDAVLWHQGESDQLISFESYIDSFTTLRNQLIALPQISLSTPFLVGGHYEYGASNEQTMTLRWLGSGQYDRYVNFVESNRMAEGSFSPVTGVHFTSLQLEELGKRYHQSYLNTPHDLHDQYDNYIDFSGNTGRNGYMFDHYANRHTGAGGFSLQNSSLSTSTVSWVPDLFFIDTVEVQTSNASNKFGGAASLGEYLYFAGHTATTPALTKVSKANPNEQIDINFGLSSNKRFFDIIPFGTKLFLPPSDSDSMAVYDTVTGWDTTIFVGNPGLTDKFIGGWVSDSMVYFCPGKFDSIMVVNPRTYELSQIGLPVTNTNLKFNNSAKIGKYVMLAPSVQWTFPLLIDMETLEMRSVYINQSSPVNRWRVGTDGDSFFLIPFLASSEGFKVNPHTLQYVSFQLPGSSYSGVTFDGISLWLTAITGSPKIVKLDPTSLNYKEFDLSPSGATSNWAMSSIFDGEKMWTVPRISDDFIIWKGAEFAESGTSTYFDLHVGGDVKLHKYAGFSSLGVDADGNIIQGTGGTGGGGGGSTTINTTGGATFLEMTANAQLTGAFQDIPDLQFNAVAGETYEISLYLLTESVGQAATEGFRLQYDFDGTATVGFQCAVPNAANGVLRKMNNSISSITITTVTANVPDISKITGIVKCDADGLLKFQIQSENTANTITVYQGSVLKVNQVN